MMGFSQSALEIQNKKAGLPVFSSSQLFHTLVAFGFACLIPLISPLFPQEGDCMYVEGREGEGKDFPL